MSAPSARPETPWALRLVPPLPSVAHRILQLASSEDAGPGEIAELTAFDPSFASELLRFANSPLFGARYEIRSLSAAVLQLGLEQVKSLATFAALNRMIRAAARVDALRRVWVHSIVTAIIAAEASPRSLSDVAYTAGLVHNLGALGLMAAYPQEYVRILSAASETGTDLLQLERTRFEIDHCAAGACLAFDWSFPHDLVAAIATHHQEPVPDASLANLVRIAWRLADVFGFPAFRERAVHEQNRAELLDYLSVPSTSWLAGSADFAEGRILALLSRVAL